MTRLARWWWRRVRAIQPTREGWWCLFAALGLGVAAVNTGNNLAYLLCSMLLALVTVSGALSDLSLRGLEVRAVLPDELYAGRLALFGAALANRKRLFASYSVDLQVLGTERRVLHVPHLGARAERLCTWEGTLPRRGPQRLPGLRIATRFPFGLFLKAGPVALDAEVLVYPRVGPLSRERLREIGGMGEVAARRRGRGHELYNLRAYRPGDEPRLIHWRTTARAGVLTVREVEEDAALDVRLVLVGTGTRDPERLEQGLAEAASLAVHLLGAGGGVEVRGLGLHVPLDRGRGQERRILTALALYDPARASSPGGATPPAPEADAPELREIRVHLD